MPSPSKMRRDAARAAAHTRYMCRTVANEHGTSAQTASDFLDEQAVELSVSAQDLASLAVLAPEGRMVSDEVCTPVQVASNPSEKQAVRAAISQPDMDRARSPALEGEGKMLTDGPRTSAQVASNLPEEQVAGPAALREDLTPLVARAPAGKGGKHDWSNENESQDSTNADPNEYASPLPLYADDMAPRINSLVVVRCSRVDDDNGVWGSLPEWADLADAYLPPGLISMKSKDQRKFLAVAKKRNVHFVAVVVEVDEVYDESADRVRYCLTVDKRSITQSQDQAVQDRWHEAERAGRLVDVAAKRSGVRRDLARQLVMYNCYKRFSQGPYDSLGLRAFLEDAGCECFAPEEAVAKFLMCLGRPNVVVDKVLQALQLPAVLARALFESCCEERKRFVRPRAVTAIHELRPLQCIDGSLAVGRAAAAAEKLPPPEGCTGLHVSVEGAGRYKFATSCTEDYDESASLFLARAVDCAQSALQLTETGAAMASGSISAGNDIGGIPSEHPVLNIGLIGDVANGKSTLCKALTGKRTQQHSSEHKAHGATIRLGYANCCVLRCCNASCPPPGCFSTAPGDAEVKAIACRVCGSAVIVERRVSFVDCPGHAELMATMLSGVSVFDAAIVVATATAPCPSSQAAAHISALATAGHSLMGKIAIVQSKADLLFASAGSAVGILGQLEQHAEQAAEAFRSTLAEGAPFFPVAALHGVGLDAVAAWLAMLPARPIGTLSAAPRMHCLRSWDVNYPGTHAVQIKGGVVGGALVQGTLRAGDIVEVRPGCFTQQVFEDKKGVRCTQYNFSIEPLLTRILQTQSGEKELACVGLGGLVGLSTTLCPTFCAEDHLQGCVVGRPGTLPPVWQLLSLSDVVAVSNASDALESETGDSDQSETEVLRDNCAASLDLIQIGREVRLHAGSASVLATVKKWYSKRNKLVVVLHRPLCTDLQSSVAVETKCAEVYRLIAHARIVDGTQCEILQPDDESCGHPSSLLCHQEAEVPKCLNTDPLEVDLPGNPEGRMLVDSPDSLGNVPEIAVDLQDSEFFRERFLDDFLLKRDSNGASPGVTMPPPELSREGGAHCVWKNFIRTVAKLNRPANHVMSFLASEGLSGHRAGEVMLCSYTWVQHKKKRLTEALQELCKVQAIPAAEWEQCVYITTCTGHQVRASSALDFTREEFPLEINLKDCALRLGSRGLGGPGKISQRLCGLMRMYARTFVICHQCRSACTHLERNRKLCHTSIELVCSGCSARRFVPSRFNIAA
mmetsp:Transcript_13860/g.27358  ORF Transcript_13860/g.27358 Transcript_13860/m.27358 type:complete len:1253 (-) Transcript_13860:538-4296(-)